MKNTIIAIIVILMCSFCTQIFAQPVDVVTQQTNNRQVETADKIYNDLGYKVSLSHFQEKENLSNSDLIKIANSYRLNHDTENAELWYSQVVQSSDEAIHKLHFAQALHCNRKYEEAKKYYLEYDKMLVDNSGTDKRGYLSAQAINRINEFNHSEVIIKNEVLINSKKLDFSPTYYEDGIVFVSTRVAHSDKIIGKDLWIDDNFMSLFFAQKSGDNAEITKLEEFSHTINTKFHEGPVTFSRDGEKLFFTRNNYNKGKRRNSTDGVMKLKIYTATKSEEEWSAAEELPFSTDEYEECHPTLSVDGRTLYFSSNRKGGQGGMDLYKSEFLGGRWSEPTNMGPTINTPGNEVFPFIHDDGTLYFASNGWGGLGGLDIFKTQNLNKERWTEAENIGTPFNSNKDDFGYILNITGTEGYLTSARKGGLGKDDIYSFIIPTDARNNTATARVCAFEAFNQQLFLPGVKVKVIEKIAMSSDNENNENEFVLSVSPTTVENEYDFKLKMKSDKISNELVKPKNFVTDKDGRFTMNVKPNRTYLMVAEKDGYTIAEETYTTGNVLDRNMLDICIPIPLENTNNTPMPDNGNCLVLEGSVVNKKYGNLIGAAKVTMINLCSGEEFVVESDKNGKFNFPCIPCGCEFVLKGEKKNFSDGMDNVSSMNLDCGKRGVVTAKVPLNPNISGSPEPTPAVLGTIEVVDPAANYAVGTVIELENIYYDFDQYYIRDDARSDLENILFLMKKFPGMEIELGSHTDARGTTNYNANLSQNRANEARQYLVDRGIQSHRVSARGYGESQLRNNCKNYKNCSEEEHQYNRRTEVKIVRMDNNVKVKYLDNGPEKIDPADPKRKFRWN